ncbi:cytochrome c3 family protein [Desulfofustis glycolicus]|uniref:Cytochrome c3 n=1 Tax=Desulfofustis glycolicus DSM 9705 TaxID=1121409 RepID=A0A1M5XAV3_9BACT|nr:cytochrome c3 family protein [Desulfofustis glycolicus]SHH96688.1 Cytochrome c3 [Desulfofustis glycolicus DSM 9705]
MVLGKMRNGGRGCRSLLVTLGCLVIVLPVAAWGGSLAATPMHIDSEASRCSECHREPTVLPDRHPDVAGMNYSQCVECHSAEEVNFAQPLPLDHIHLLSGIGCGDCHSDPATPGPVGMDTCLECHGSARDVADETAQLDPNPHDSPHYGVDLDCTLCHYQHQPSELFCSQCHTFDMVVP